MKNYLLKLGFSWKIVSGQISKDIYLWTQWIWPAMFCFQISLHFTFSQLPWNNIWYRKSVSNTHRQKNSQPSETTGPLHLYCFCNKYRPSHRIPSKRSSGNLKIQANHCHATLNAFISMSIKFQLLMDQSSSAASHLHIQPASCWAASGHEIHEYIKTEKGNLTTVIIQLNDHILFTSSSRVHGWQPRIPQRHPRCSEALNSLLKGCDYITVFTTESHSGPRQRGNSLEVHFHQVAKTSPIVLNAKTWSSLWKTVYVNVR